MAPILAPELPIATATARRALRFASGGLATIWEPFGVWVRRTCQTRKAGPPNGTRTRMDGPRAVREHPSVDVLPHRRRRGGGGTEDLCHVPGAGGLPRARPREPDRSRRVGRLLRAGTAPCPQAGP